MCTALSFPKGNHYFGRNLDLEGSYGEKVCLLPRNVPIAYRHEKTMERHYAMLGMAVVMDGMPLFYDAVNETGLCMAGLNFPGNACYFKKQEGKDNVAPFEFIPWILGQCADVKEARERLNRLNLADTPYSEQIPLATLHWLISDREGSLVVESTADGLQVYENPVGVLTNNPPFPYQLFNLNNYRALRADTPENHLGTPLDVYCQGLGGLGLPGDVSSMSRFVRPEFHSQMSQCQEEEDGCVSQCFHLLGSVEMPKGSCRVEKGMDYTVYSCCCSADTGRYYYTTYDNRQITCVDMNREDLEGTALRIFPLVKKQNIFFQN